MQHIRTRRLRLGLAIIACALVAIAVTTQRAHAAGTGTLTVNTTADTVDPGGCVTAPTCSLRDAVIAADAAGGGTIDVPAGTYTLTIPSAGTDDPTTGDLDITAGSNVTVTGAGAGSTIIDADQIDRAFAVQDGATLDLSGVEIENGAASSASSGEETGGAIYSDGTLSLDGVALTDDTAQSGGDIYADTDAVSTTITDSVLSDSQAGSDDSEDGDNGGGAIDLEGGTLSVDASTFAGDEAAGYAGAIEADAGDVNISDSTFSADTAAIAGAIEADEGGVTIESSTFSDDSAQLDYVIDGNGGAILQDPGAGLSITSSVFSDDSATDGGAIAYGLSGEFFLVAEQPAAAQPDAAPASGDLTISDTQITGSSAVNGGAISLDGEGTVDIDHTTIDDNHATSSPSFDGEGDSDLGGGGIYVDEVGSATITDTTIADNGAPYGAGVYFDSDSGPVQFTNDTVADNTTGDDANSGDGSDGGGVYAPADADDDGSGGFVNTIIADNVGGDCADGNAGDADLGNNLDSDGSCFPSDDGPGVDPGAGVKPNVEASSASLDLGPLQDNGGPVIGAPGDTGALLTELPGAGSAAIGEGSTTVCPGDDERGVPRTSGCDAGAVQVAPAVLSITDTAPATGTTGVPFNDAVTVANAGPAPSGQTTLTFTAPSGETVFGAAPAQGTCTTSGSTVTCDLGDVASGASTTVTLVLAGNAAGSFTNPVSATNAEGSTATGSATTQVSGPSGTSTTTVTVPAQTVNLPTAVTDAASQLSMTGGTLNGTVTTGGGAPTTYFFEYGTTTAYGLVTPVATTTTDGPVSATLSNLDPGTTYHYRVIAVNADGQATGADMSFTTAGTTSLGSLLLDSKTLSVTGNKLAAKFTCQSSTACVFKFTVSSTAEIGRTKKIGPVFITPESNPLVTIPAGQTVTLHVRVTTTALALLRKRHGQSTAKLTTRPRSGQTGLIVQVHLRG